MRAIRSLAGLAALAAVAVLGLGQLDAATAERRRAAAERNELRALYALLPADLQPPQTRLERQPAGPARGMDKTWLLARRTDGNVAAYVVTGTAQGWGGEISVQVVADTRGQLLGSRIVAHAETPAYAGDLPTRWQHADQLTGATVSAHAIDAAIASALAQARALSARVAP